MEQGYRNIIGVVRTWFFCMYLQDNGLSLLFAVVFDVVSVGLLQSQGASSSSCSCEFCTGSADVSWGWQ